jgi:hypothetical protein
MSPYEEDLNPQKMIEQARQLEVAAHLYAEAQRLLRENGGTEDPDFYWGFLQVVYLNWQIFLQAVAPAQGSPMPAEELIMKLLLRLGWWLESACANIPTDFDPGLFGSWAKQSSLELDQLRRFHLQPPDKEKRALEPTSRKVKAEIAPGSPTMVYVGMVAAITVLIGIINKILPSPAKSPNPRLPRRRGRVQLQRRRSSGEGPNPLTFNSAQKAKFKGSMEALMRVAAERLPDKNIDGNADEDAPPPTSAT